MMKPQIRAILLFLLILCFGVLIFGGYMIKKKKPPIPDLIISQDGSTIITSKKILDGQNYYFSRGDHHFDTIWGHGSYFAPDWSDYLHRLGLYLAVRHYELDQEKAKSLAQYYFKNFDKVQKAKLEALVTQEIKKKSLQCAKKIFWWLLRIKRGVGD